MCGGGDVQDNSHIVEQQRIAEARRQEQKQDLEDKINERKFKNQLQMFTNRGTREIDRAFTDLGLNPDDFAQVINQELVNTKQQVPDLDTNPGIYFTGIGDRAIESATDKTRTNALNTIDNFAGFNFADKKITDTVDDPFIAAILGEKKTDAEKYAENLFDRGIVTEAGLGSALQEISDSQYQAKQQLEEIGLSLLTQGRSDLETIANDARTEASNLRLGQDFDPFSFSTEIDTSANKFFETLGDALKSNTPDDLFDTNKIFQQAGRGQGAQNTTFNPFASFDPSFNDKEDEDEEEKSPFGAF